MFVRPSFASVFGVFKPKFGDELLLPLTSGLQRNNVPPEVELSEYRRIPSPGNESPSGLLGCEASNGPPITDLDLFFQMFYCYFCDKGLWCIIVKRIVELLCQGFTIGLAGFFLLCVDWNRLRNSPCWGYAVKSGIKSCDLVKEAIRHHPLTPLTLDKVVIVGCLGIFFIYYIICFLRIFTQLKGFLKIRQFYCNRYVLLFLEDYVCWMRYFLVLINHVCLAVFMLLTIKLIPCLGRHALKSLFQYKVHNGSVWLRIFLLMTW